MPTKLPAARQTTTNSIHAAMIFFGMPLRDEGGTPNQTNQCTVLSRWWATVDALANE